MRRACKHPLNSAKPLQQLHRRSETVLVFPSCPNIIVLVGGVLLPPPHAVSGADRLARRPSCKACKSPPRCLWLKRFCTLPVRPHAAIRACLRCLWATDTAFHSHCSVNVITPSPSCRLWSISACRAKRHAERIERIINAFVPRKALRRPHADFGAGQRQDFPTA